MNRDQVLAIARELGIDDEWRGGYMTYDVMIAFASRIEAATREECAKICESKLLRYDQGYQCAAAIRKSEG